MVKNRWAIEEKTHREILQLLQDGVGIRTISRRLGVGIRTVQRRRDLLRKNSLDPGDIDFRPVAARTCPVHGLVNFWPCVACEAERAKGVHLPENN